MTVDDIEKRRSSSPAADGYAEGEEPVVFHYSREHRLQGASKQVQDYYANNGISMGKGLFRSLVQTRMSRTLLIVIVLMVLFIGFYGVFSSGSAAAAVGGIPVSLSAFSFEDTVYASVRFDEAAAEEQTSVSVRFCFLIDGGTVFAETEESEIYTGKELFLRTTITDYDIVTVTAAVMAGEEQTELSTPVSRS
ncbi:MAG TPA: hypothetical protein IAA30_04995 [Candidatus Treponema faecavium]|nr:hypothetical protein [Candidatus Treponema faecavium]